MGKVKVIFVLAGIALVGMLGCIGMFFIAPTASSASTTVSETTEESEKDEEVTEEAALEEEAREEVERFKQEYGMEISFEDMLEQVKLKKDYESKYSGSYRLEEVFLADYPTDAEVGDEGDDAYFSALDEIQAYVEKYNIDESRYAAMTVEEELAALEVEYGKLDASEEDSEDSKTQEHAEDTEDTEEAENEDTQEEGDAPK